MARVINECHFGASRLALEFLQGVEKIGAVDVVIFRDLEAVRLELGGDRLGVGHRIDQAREMLVIAHADDEGYALFLPRRRHERRSASAKRKRDIESGLGMASAGRSLAPA